MPFKKLHPEIQEQLLQKKITSPTPFQCSSIPVIKSGVNTYCIAPRDNGKTTTLILTTLHKLKCEAVGNAPRAVVLLKNNEKALEVYNLFISFTKYNSLRVYIAHDDQHVDLQKSEIFEGIDILLSTPMSLKKLFLCNGVPKSELKIFSVDDAEFLTQNSAYTALISISQSIKKCQYILYAKKMEPKLKRFESHFMEYSKIVTV